MQKKGELNFHEAKEKALRYLEFRSHSEKELRDKLYRAGAKEEDILAIMEFLKEYRFIDDKSFAEKYAHDLKTLKKFGKIRIKSELFKKGISSDIIDDVLETFDWESEDVLTPLVLKKLSGDFQKKSIDRCIRYFLYKGYSFDEIKASIDKIKTEEEYDI